MRTVILAAVSVAAIGLSADAAAAQYGGHYQPYYQPYYQPAYAAPAYHCPTAPKVGIRKVGVRTVGVQESAVDKLIKEAKLRKAISELPKDQQEVMLRRLGWWKEKEPGSVPALTAAEVEQLKGLLQKK